MIKQRELLPDVFYVGAIDWDRRLFDALIPLPDGTTYNSYVVRGKDKIALIDTADPNFTKDWLTQINELELPRVDYIVANHAEQDHSGSLKAALENFPEAKIVTNAKCKEILMGLLPLEDKDFMVVEDGQSLELGSKTLQFYLAPWVHWPETMFTYIKEDRLLFTCDFLGSHYAGSELFVQDQAAIYIGAKRYYAEIMMPFRTQVRKNLELLAKIRPLMIAPSHGPVYDKPRFIIEAYRDWSSDNVKNEVLIAYVSMHDSTRQMVDILISELISKNITVKKFDLASMDLGKLAMDLVDAATVVVATPTVLAGAHPLAAYAVFLANALRPKTRYLAIIGSYSWSGRMVEQLSGMIPNLKVEVLKTLLIKGYPRATDAAELKNLAALIADKHACLNCPK